MSQLPRWDFESKPLTNSSFPPEIAKSLETLSASGSGVTTIRKFTFRDVQPKGPPALPSVEEVVKKYEANPEMAAAMSAARNRISNILASDRPALYHLRLRAGLSQTTLAERMGTTQPRLSLIEQGKTEPTVTVIANLRKALGCSWEEVMTALTNGIETAK